MLVNLVPEFLAVLAAPDPPAAYHDYLERHGPVLQSYWRNYVLDPTSPHAERVIAAALRAERADLERLLEDVDVAAIADEALGRSLEQFEADCPVDLYLMVGVGAANAGELVVGGRGIAFVCLEHFTGRANPQTYGMGLAPHLLPLWIAHEVAHAVRYTSPSSRADLRRLVADLRGYYDYWDTGSRASLRELLVNEGVAVAAAQAVAPGFEPWEYFGYTRRQYRRIRELDAFLRRAAAPLLDESGLGLRLRFLSGGMSAAARMMGGRMLPERSGYYLGLRLVESSGRPRSARWACRAHEPAAEGGAAPQPTAARGAGRSTRPHARHRATREGHDARRARLRATAPRMAGGRGVAGGHRRAAAGIGRHGALSGTVGYEIPSCLR